MRKCFDCKEMTRKRRFGPPAANREMAGVVEAASPRDGGGAVWVGWCAWGRIGRRGMRWVSPTLLSSEGDVHRTDQALAEPLLPDRLDVATAGEKCVDHVRVPLNAPALDQNTVDLR